MRIRSLVLISVFLSAPWVVADPGSAKDTTAPQAQASPALDNDFLLLPAYDLEREESAPIKVGDRIRLKAPGFKVAGGANPKLTVPLGAASLQDQGFVIFPESSGDALRLIAVALRAGDLTLPSLAILSSSDSSAKAIGRSNPLPLKVESSLAASDKREPVPMRPPISLDFPKWIIGLGVFFALAVAAGIVYAVVLWSRRKRPAVAPLPAGPPKPEDEVALAAFAELEQLALARNGDYKGHYFRISEILKTYIGARYRFDAPESTSREIVSYLEDRKSIDDRTVDRLETLLNRLDLVKFTDHVPAGTEPALVLQDARDWVHVTRRPLRASVISESPKP